MRRLFIVLFVWLTTVVAFCADAPVRIAILAGAGERAPKAGVSWSNAALGATATRRWVTEIV
jgi:hypothetical protein